MASLDRIREIVEQPICDLGYEIVRISLLGHNRVTLQIMIERQDEKSIKFEDCEKVSHLVSALLDHEDPIEGKYSLQISSPGIDRPLTKLADYSRFQGLIAELSCKMPINRRKNFTGRITKIEDEVIFIDVQDNKEIVGIDYNNINSAKLVLNDELIEKTK